MTDRNYDNMTGTCATCGPDTEMTKAGGCFPNRRALRSVRIKNSGPRVYIYTSEVKGRVLMTAEERARRIALEGCCAFCGSTERLVLDHCHISGEFRGVLCASCNKALGAFQDNIERLQKAIDYLTPYATEGEYVSYVTARASKRRQRVNR